MNLQLKRKLSEKGILELFLISLLAGTISIRTQQYHYTLQFVLTAFLTIGFLLFIDKISREEVRNSIFILFSVFLYLKQLKLILGISAGYVVLASILKYLDNDEFILSALIAHVLDVMSTYLVLPNGRELNPLTNLFITQLGVLKGLTISKLLFVALPCFYVLRSFDADDSEVFFKVLIIIGASMASRNFLI